MIAFVRRGRDRQRAVLCVCNFTPVVRRDYRLGVPGPGAWVERINTDSHFYGGSNVGNPCGQADAEPVPAHGQAWSVQLTLPPLASVLFEWQH